MWDHANLKSSVWGHDITCPKSVILFNPCFFSSKNTWRLLGNSFACPANMWTKVGTGVYRFKSQRLYKLRSSQSRVTQRLGRSFRLWFSKNSSTNVGQQVCSSDFQSSNSHGREHFTHDNYLVLLGVMMFRWLWVNPLEKTGSRSTPSRGPDMAKHGFRSVNWLCSEPETVN